MRISDLLGEPDLGINLCVAGGKGRLERAITWCAPTEHMDPTPFLTVNALVLTNGIGLNFTDFRIWDAYVERLADLPVSGLAFGLGPAHHELPEGLQKACMAHDLPLLSLPPEVPFVLVMRRVEQAIAAERYQELLSGWELADECTRLAAEGRSLQTVLERVADAVHARVAVVDQGGFELIRVGNAAVDATRTTLRLPSGRSEYFKLKIEGINSDVVLQPILGPVAAVIAMQLSYTLGSELPVHSVEAAKFVDALYRESGVSNDNFQRYATEAGFAPYELWGAVLIGGVGESSPMKLRAVAWRARVALEKDFSVVRHAEMPGLTTLLAQRPRGKTRLLDAARDILKDVQECSVLVTESVTLEELPFALQLARRHIGSPGVRLAPAADLAGIIQGLPSRGLVSMCHRILAPLKADGSNTLTTTLEAYLRHGGKSSEICEELFIHRNTLTYRLRKIQDLLQLDLSDGEVRATFFLALQVVAGTRGDEVTPGWSE